MTDDPGPILVVEDESRVCRAIRSEIEGAGYRTLEATSVEAARRVVASTPLALVILDLGMPDGNGLDLLRALDPPVIVVSGHATEADRVVGLELGADDYVSKPFSSRELVARVRCVLRRADPHTKSSDGDTDTISFGALAIDRSSREVRVADVPLHLTRVEFDLLWFLAVNPRQVFTKSHLLDAVWHDGGAVTDWTNESTVTEHVRRLRKKLHPRVQSRIVTVWGVGYRFEPEDAAAGECTRPTAGARSRF